VRDSGFICHVGGEYLLLVASHSYVICELNRERRRPLCFVRCQPVEASLICESHVEGDYSAILAGAEKPGCSG